MFWRKWTESLIKDKTVQDQDNTNSARSNEQSLKMKSRQSPSEISCLCFKGVASSNWVDRIYLDFLKAFEKYLKNRQLNSVRAEKGKI